MEKIFKRLLSFAVALFMVLGMVPAGAFDVFAAETDVAYIGETGYETLQAAIDAAGEGDVITVVTDITDADATISKNVTIDLGDKTLTDAYIIVKGQVTIQNGHIKNENEPYPLVVQDGGELTINNVELEASKSDRAIWVRSGSSLVFNSGSVLATKGANNTKTGLIAAIYTDTNTDVTINGGTITVDTPDNKANGIYGNYNNANVTVNGGKISTSGKGYCYGIRVDGDITVTDGEIVTNEKCYGYSSGITYGNNAALYTALGNVTISGGKITTNGYSGYAVYVGRSYSAAAQTITITGGEFANNLSETDMSAGGHSAPALIYELSAETVTASIADGTFTGFSQTLAKGDSTTLTVSGGTFDQAIDEAYLAEDVNLVQNADGSYTVQEPTPAPAGSINGGLVNVQDPNRTFLTIESWITYANESIVVKVFDANDTLLVTSSLVDNDRVILGKENWGGLSTFVGINCTDSWWNTSWEEGKLSPDYVPAKATLYIDGVEMNTSVVQMRAAGTELSVNWAEVPGVAPAAATGTLGKCYISEDDTRARIYGEITGMANAKESIVVELYSGETLLATTTLANADYLSYATLGVNMVISGKTSSSWNTVWEEGHPVANMCPDKAVLYIDGNEMNTAVVTLGTIDDLGTPYVWEEITGVAPVASAVAQTMDAEGNVVGSYETFEAALAAACADANVTRIEILADSETTTVESLEYYDVTKALTIGAPAGESYTVTIKPAADSVAIRVQDGGSLTIEENVTFDHLDVVANGFATTGENMTIDGTLKAISLKQWTNNGTITVSETGKVWLGFGDGQLDLAYGNGTVTVNGTGDKTTDQFKAGYSGTRGNGNTLNLNNTSFEGGAWFNVNGSNGAFNVNNSVLKVSGGDYAGTMTVASSGNAINLTNGSVLKTGTLTLGAGNTLTLDASSSVEVTTLAGAGTLVIDATGLQAGDTYTAITGDVSTFTGEIEVTGANLTAEIEDGKIILKAAGVAEVNGTKYPTMSEAFAAAQDNDTIIVLQDVTMDQLVKVEGKTLTIAGDATLTLADKLEVYGETTLNISCGLSGEVILGHNAILKDSTINGDVFVAGKVTFRGDNTVNMLYDFGELTDYYGTEANMEWTVESGASLKMLTKARYGLGYGDNVTINGELTDALTARDQLTEEDASFFTHGLVGQESSSWKKTSYFTVNDAYVIIGSNNSFGNKSGNYGGTYYYTFDNVVLDGSRITFYEAGSTSTLTFNSSDVKIGTFMTKDADSVYTLNDTKLVSTTTTNGTDENNTNGGTLILNNSSISYAASVVNTGVIELDATSSITIDGKLTGAGKIVIDATGMTAGEYTGITADVSEYTGEIEVTGSDLTAEIEDGKIILKAAPVAKIGDVEYPTLQAALNEAVEGDTIQLLEGTISEGTIQLPTAVKNVTIKGADGKTSILKDSTIKTPDGNAYSISGLTIDGIVFDNSNIVLTGWRNGEETIEDLTITNCEFKNLVRTSNEAAVHINKDAAEAVKNFTFTNNVIDGVSGASNSGIYAQVTGNVTVENNVINNVAFRPYVIQITTDDGIADTFTVTGNTFSGSAAGRAQALGNNAEGTDNVTLTVTENIFKDITNAQQICYWNFNSETTTADLSHNYYDIDIQANPSRIYYNGSAADVEDLVEMGIFPYYADEAKTILVEAPAPALPTATVTEIENEDLTFALNFKADDATQAQIDYYGDWYADYVLTVNKDVTFNANGNADGWLSGQYDNYNPDSWVNVPFEDVPLKAGESIRIMKYASEAFNNPDLKLTYNTVLNGVKDFNCGVFFDKEFLAANPDLEVTLELRVYNNTDETESYVIGETYVFTAPAPELPTATATEIENENLTFAMNFKADEATYAQLYYYGGWYADYVLTVNKDVTFNADGGADGFLSGQYDKWSENWVNVPYGKGNVTLNAGEGLQIMKFAAELMGKTGLRYTYKEVYEVVKDFDCGVFFEDAFLAANPDLEVTLELRIYNPADETENYLIGETYVFTLSDFVAENVETGEQYATVSAALEASAEGQTVRLLKDVTGEKAESIILILNDRTLDLNGFTLEAGNVVAVTGGAKIQDSTNGQGLLMVAKANLTLPSNDQLPIWSADDAGYRFVTLEMDNYEVAKNAEYLSLMYWFEGVLDDDMKHHLEKVADNELQVALRVSYTYSDGSNASLDIIIPSETVVEYANTEDEPYFLTTIRGLNDLSSNCTITTYVFSGDVEVAGVSYEYTAVTE